MASKMMKYIKIIFALLFSFLSFTLAIQKYDERLILNTIDFYNAKSSKMEEEIPLVHNDSTAYLLKFKGNFSSIDIDSFFSLLQECLLNTDLNFYQYKADEFSHTIFTYSNDSMYCSKIVTYGNSITQLTDFPFYSSQSNSDENRLVKPLRSTTLQILPLTAYQEESFTIHGPYYVTSNHNKSIDTQLLDFISRFSTYFPDLSIEYRTVAITVQYPQSITVTDYILLLCTAIILVLLCNIELLTNAKKIVLLKLNGYSNLFIYHKNFISPNCMVILLIIFIYCLQFPFYLPLSFAKTNDFIFNLLKILSLFIMIVLSCSIFLYITIILVKPNSLLKGKSLLVHQYRYLYLLKTIFTLLSYPILVSGLSILLNIILSLKQEPEYLSRISHSFAVGSINYALEADMTQEFTQQKLQAITQTLYNRNEAFYFMDATGLLSIDLPVYLVSRSYLNCLGPIINDAKQLLIAIPKGRFSTEKQSEIVLSLQEQFLVPLEEILLVEYHNQIFPLYSYSPSVFLEQKNIQEAVFIADRALLLSSNTFFIHDENDFAQIYLDTLFQEQDITPYFHVKNLANEYLLSKRYCIRTSILPLFCGFLVVIMQILFLLQLLLVDRECNGKRYAIMIVEGYTILSLASQIIAIEGCIFIISDLLLLWIHQSNALFILAYGIILFFLSLLSSCLFVYLNRNQYLRRIK